MIDDPAPPAVRREVESYLDDYSRSLDLGLAQHFGVEPLNRVAKLSRVDPANAIPTTLPQADPVNEADVQHAAWVLVRKDRLQLDDRTVPIADMMACGQTVVDKERVARETKKWLERGQGKFRPLVMAHSGRFLIVSGLHHTQAAVDAGATEMRVQVMSDKQD